MSSHGAGPSQPWESLVSFLPINLLMQIGMEIGYVHSLMAQIIEKYDTDRSENDHLTQYRVQYYSNFNLTSDDIQDLGFDYFVMRPWYSLKPPLIKAVVSTIMGLQSALLFATSLLTERETIFQVDAKQMFINILHRTNNIHLSNMAWTGLRNWLQRGKMFLFKYSN